MVDHDALEQVAERWLSTLQHDFKDYLRVVADDPDLEDPLRDNVVTALLYILAPGDVVPDSMGALGYLDDALAMRVALDEVRIKQPAQFDAYRDRIPELVESVEGEGSDLDVFRAALGDVYEPFKARAFSPERNEVKGKRAKELIDDPDGANWLNEEVLVTSLKMDFKPAALQSAARKAATVIPIFQQKLRR
jgi:uncharacterized membrane protein YkvA (DUF1232 family)